MSTSLESSARPPVFLGMNNPHSDRDGTALLPFPRGCAGWRLWKMVNEVTGISRAEWCRRTERHNLANSRIWDTQIAAARAPFLTLMLQGRQVFLLGRQVAAMMWASHLPQNVWSSHEGMWVCPIPHTSGLCRDYNDPLVRLAVAYRIEEALTGAGRPAGASPSPAP